MLKIQNVNHCHKTNSEVKTKSFHCELTRVPPSIWSDSSSKCNSDDKRATGTVQERPQVVGEQRGRGLGGNLSLWLVIECPLVWWGKFQTSRLRCGFCYGERGLVRPETSKPLGAQWLFPFSCSVMAWFCIRGPPTSSEYLFLFYVHASIGCHLFFVFIFFVYLSHVVDLRCRMKS